MTLKIVDHDKPGMFLYISFLLLLFFFSFCLNCEVKIFHLFGK